MIARVKKLLALSGSPNEHEAAAAAAMVATLLASHRLTLDAIQASTIIESATVWPEARWARHLLQAVATACGCRVVIVSTPRFTAPTPEYQPVTTTTVARVIGTADAVRAAEETVTAVSRVIARRVTEAWRAHVQDMTDPHYGVYPSLLEEGAEADWQESFALGCVEAVVVRMEGDLHRQYVLPPFVPLATKDLPDPKDLLDPTAGMLTCIPAQEPRAAALAAVDAYLTTTYPTLRRIPSEETYRIHPGAMGQGRAEPI